jgi:predicted heme/steroid binding protein
MKRVVVLLSLLILAVMLSAILVGCGVSGSNTSEPANNMSTEGPVDTGKTFTVTELAKFDGKNGNPAYVAVDGVVYDVTGSAKWPQGDHTPCNLDTMAGRDLSEEIKQAPANMRSLLQNMPVVGTLQQ